MASRTRISDPLDQVQLAGFAARRRERARLEVEDLLEAVDWALRHPATDPEPYAAAPTARTVINDGWLADPRSRTEVLEQAAFEVFDDPWTPAVDWAAFAPLAAAMGRSTVAGKALVTDGLVMASRMPKLFEAVKDGRVEVWRARRIAQAVRMRPVDVTDYVDAKVTPIADSIGATRLEALIDEAMLKLHAEERELEIEEARESYGVELNDSFHGFHGGGAAAVAEMRICGDIKDLTAFESTLSTVARMLGEQQRHEGVFPEPLEVRKARAVGILADPDLASAFLKGQPSKDLRSTHSLQLVVHLSADQARTTLEGFEPVAKIDGPLRARLTEQVATWCNRPETSFNVLPVIDLNEHTPSVSDSVTVRMGDRAKLRTPTCVFPYCDRPSHRCDVDHRIPVGDALGQHGTSCDCNLVPLCRHHHRLKTHAGWAYTEIESQVWLWTDPNNRSYLRDHHTTRDVTIDDRPALVASPDWTERRDQLRRQRIPTRPTASAGCRQQPVTDPADDPPPF
ncbi:MAG: HNH endonuclease signature motif containing protein [Marmoricola sp.]